MAVDHSSRQPAGHTELLIRLVYSIALATLLFTGTPAIASDVAVLITGPDNAELIIDGQQRGTFPLAGPVELAPTRHLVECRLTGHEPYSQDLELTAGDQQLRLHVRLAPLSRRTAWTMNLLLAGVGQRYLEKPVKGWVFTAVEVGGLLAALYGELALQNHRNDYLLTLEEYNQAINAQTISILRQELEQLDQDMSTDKSLRDIGLLAVGGALAASVLDAIFFFPHVATGAGAAPPPTTGLAEPVATDTWSGFHAGLYWNF